MVVVGQSHGAVSIALANGFPDLILVVQDLPKIIEDANTKAPASLSQLISRPTTSSNCSLSKMLTSTTSAGYPTTGQTNTVLRFSGR